MFRVALLTGCWCVAADFPSGGRDHSFVRPSGAGGGGGRGSGAGHPYFSEDLDPSATRSLFVGNIPKDISVYELRDIFQRYGNVLVRGEGGRVLGGGVLCIVRDFLCLALCMQLYPPLYSCKVSLLHVYTEVKTTSM